MTTPTILSEEFPELLLSGWDLLKQTCNVLILYYRIKVNKKIIMSNHVLNKFKANRIQIIGTAPVFQIYLKDSATH